MKIGILGSGVVAQAVLRKNAIRPAWCLTSTGSAFPSSVQRPFVVPYGSAGTDPSEYSWCKPPSTDFARTSAVPRKNSIRPPLVIGDEAPQLLYRNAGVPESEYSWCNPPSTDFARTSAPGIHERRDWGFGARADPAGGPGTPGPSALCGRSPL